MYAFALSVHTSSSSQCTRFSFLACMRILHRFNMVHDRNPSSNIMASPLVIGPGLFKWSSYSAGYLEQSRAQGLTACLRDTPGVNGTVAISGTSLPGRNLTRTEQCRKSRGSNFTFCNIPQTPDVSTHAHTHHTHTPHMHTHHTHTTHTPHTPHTHHTHTHTRRQACRGI